MAIKRLDELAVAGKRVFCRVDFNVPLTDDGNVSDDTRISKVLPTIKRLRDAGARVICASHLGRPKGKVVEKLRMEPVGARLADLLGDGDVLVTDEPSGDGARQVIDRAREGDVVLLENLRFDARETENEDSFARELAALADIYLNDAFGTAHRAHASTVGMVQYVEQRGAGLLMFRELEMLGRLLSGAPKPFIAILGGAKVSDKLPVITNLLGKVDALIIGGAMANTFIAAQGGALGRSMVESDALDAARQVLARAQSKGVDLLLPVDAVVAPSLDAAGGETVPADAIPAEQMALDIGPQTLAAYRDRLSSAGAVFWNGPMGVFEKEPFAAGTMGIAEAVAASSAMSVVGGGDSVAAVVKSGTADKITHISTGGGASLEFMSGKTLPGVAALEV
ncbi:MAG: phosphoglycerate kinase [Deltaproteobacteria bacterium]|nr:phosphoglycerate kinase [Deltaproteobacteria bacterium]